MTKLCPVCGAQHCDHLNHRGQRTKGYGSEYQRARAQVLSEERSCWICGQEPTRTDPLEADHLIPKQDGGSDARANLRAAHRSCNRKRAITWYVPA